MDIHSPILVHTIRIHSFYRMNTADVLATNLNDHQIIQISDDGWYFEDEDEDEDFLEVMRFLIWRWHSLHPSNQALRIEVAFKSTDFDDYRPSGLAMD